MPKVSVIIPVYNVEKYLRECLDSVINQTLKDIEIICINDGSADGSLNILKEYCQKDSRIIVVDKKNEGAGKAREVGIKQATGEYLAFLDGDDLYLTDFLEKMYDNAKENNSDIVICPVKKYDTKIAEYVDASASFLVDNIPPQQPFCAKDIPDFIFTSFQNWNWNKIFRRSFIEFNDIHFQTIYRTNDLYFTCCALVLAERISTINEPLVIYRIGMSENSQATNFKHPFDFYYAFKTLRKFLIKNNLYDLYKQSYVNWALKGCTYNIWSLRKQEKIQQKLIKKVVTKGLKELDLKYANNVIPQYPNDFAKFEMYKKQYYKDKINNIFSIRNEGICKAITVFGIRIKIKSKKLVERKEKQEATERLRERNAS